MKRVQTPKNRSETVDSFFRLRVLVKETSKRDEIFKNHVRSRIEGLREDIDLYFPARKTRRSYSNWELKNHLKRELEWIESSLFDVKTE